MQAIRWKATLLVAGVFVLGITSLKGVQMSEVNREDGCDLTAVLPLPLSDEALVDLYASKRQTVNTIAAQIAAIQNRATGMFGVYDQEDHNKLTQLENELGTAQFEMSQRAETLFERLRPAIERKIGYWVFGKGVAPRNAISPSEKRSFHEDCVGQTLLNLVDGITKFSHKNAATLQTYISAVAERAVLTLIRKENTRYKDLTVTYEPLDERRFRAQEDGVRCVTDVLNYDQGRADLLRRLTAAFAGNERLAIILVLQKVDGLTAREVAAMFSLPKSTINSLTRKAVALYRDRFPQNGTRA